MIKLSTNPSPIGDEEVFPIRNVVIEAVRVDKIELAWLRVGIHYLVYGNTHHHS